MRRIILPALLLVAAAFAGGCVGEGQVAYSGDYYATTPELVEVSPGVQVIADYDEPIFFSDGVYWRFYNNGWYRSSYYTGGWGYVGLAPEHLRGIDRPYNYTHYRPAGWSPSRQANIRDHRATPVERPPVRSQPVRTGDNRAPISASHAPPMATHPGNTRGDVRVQTPTRSAPTRTHR